MTFVVDKEYQINEVFKHEQTGKTLMCVQASPLCGGCVGDDYADCGSNFCCPRDRKNGISVIYKEVTGPVEGMLYRACGRLFKLLNRSHWGLTCACCTKSGLMCSTLDLRVFGEMTTTDWCWELVEEKEAGAPKAEPKKSSDRRRLVLCDADIRNKSTEAVKEYNETDGKGYPKTETTKPEAVEERWIKLGPTRHDGDKVYFCILEQSHIQSSFTPTGDCFNASNGYKLYSIACPATSSDGCCMRGCNPGCNFDIICMTSASHEKFIEAVEEYNATNGCGLPKKAEEFPKEGEEYHFITSDGERISTNYMTISLVDRSHKALGNCFKTEADVSYAADEIAATLKRVHEKLGY